VKYFQESLTINQDIGDKLGVAACDQPGRVGGAFGQTGCGGRLYGLVESQLDSLSIHLLYLDQAGWSGSRPIIHLLSTKRPLKPRFGRAGDGRIRQLKLWGDVEGVDRRNCLFNPAQSRLSYHLLV
jgi:hypothetical protein